MPVSVCILVVCQNCQDHFLFQTGLYTLSPFNLPILCQPCQLVMDPCAWLFLWFCFRWSCSPPMIQLAQMHYHGPWLTASTAPNIWGAKSLWRRDSWHLLTTQDIMIMSQTKDQASKYQKTMKASKFSRLKHFTWVCGIEHFELHCKAGLWMPVSCGRRVFSFGVETKIAGGTGSHLTGPGRAGCKLLVKTYGNPSSRAACNGCLDGDGLGEFGYHPQDLWLLKQTQETQKNVRHDSQIKKCTVELFKCTIDLIESSKSSHRIIWYCSAVDSMKTYVMPFAKALKSLAWVPESCAVLFVDSSKIRLLSAFWNTRRSSFLQFRPAKRVVSCQVDPGGSVEKVSWKNPKKWIRLTV